VCHCERYILGMGSRHEPDARQAKPLGSARSRPAHVITGLQRRWRAAYLMGRENDMSNGLRPSSLDGIKRLARTLKAERGITHTEALEIAARQAGYQSYTHARHQLEAKTPPIGDYPVRPKGGPTVGHNEFLDLCRAAWVQT